MHSVNALWCISAFICTHVCSATSYIIKRNHQLIRDMMSLMWCNIYAKCAAVCCSVLQCVAVCCSVLQCDVDESHVVQHMQLQVRHDPFGHNMTHSYDPMHAHSYVTCLMYMGHSSFIWDMNHSPSMCHDWACDETLWVMARHISMCHDSHCESWLVTY